MAKLYFYYAAMNAGKSTVLLQSSYNYQERGMRTLVFVPAVVVHITAHAFVLVVVEGRHLLPVAIVILIFAHT